MREGIKVTQSQASDIEKQTRGQSKSPRWKEERQWRITGSRFGEICRTTDRRDKDSLALSIFKPANLDHVPAVQHGRTYEASAIEKFKVKTGKDVSACGLFVDPDYPFLGASPDGIVHNEDSVIEVKCPFAGKDSMIRPGKNFGFLEFVDQDQEQYRLKRTHPYYYQVMGEMKLSKRNKCYFIVFTLKDLFYEEINLDEEFFTSNMLPALKEFYYQYYLPLVATSLLD